MERIESRQKVKKAVILAGGLGTRFLPATLCLAKELFPIGDKPIIMYHIEDLIKAGIDEILIVGTGPPSGVPLPVVKSIIWAPAAVKLVIATISLPGPFKSDRPLFDSLSP